MRKASYIIGVIAGIGAWLACSTGWKQGLHGGAFRHHRHRRGRGTGKGVLRDMENRIPDTTPILRLREFVQWAKSEGLCKSEPDFERQCGLASKYIANNSNTGKGNIGTEMLGRIIKIYPQLNLAWLCTGEGYMCNEPTGLNADYKQAYLASLKQINALNSIIKQLNKEITLKNK